MAAIQSYRRLTHPSFASGARGLFHSLHSFKQKENKEVSKFRRLSIQKRKNNLNMQ